MSKKTFSFVRPPFGWSVAALLAFPLTESLLAAEPGAPLSEPLLNRELADARKSTIPLNYRGRYLLIQRDSTIDKAVPPGTARYFLEPPLFFLPTTDGTLGLPQWIQSLEYDADGTAKIEVAVVLKDQHLLDAAAGLIRTADLSYLQQCAREQNHSKPMQVLVETLPVSVIRLDLVDLSGKKGDILASGEIEVSRTAEQKSVWMHLAPATLQRVLELTKKGRLGVRPYYSYPNVQMSKAEIKNFGQSEIRDRLNAWLKHRNLTGEGDITQQDIDNFIRETHGYIGSRIIAESPTAANFLVNNITTLTSQLFEPASQVPFVTGNSQMDEQKLAEHLGALGWTRSSGSTWESVLERTDSQGSSRGLNAGVSGQVGDGSKGVGVKLGFGSTNEQVTATLQRTGLLMQQLDNRQGWMASKIQKYRVKSYQTGSEISYAASVSVGLGAVNGFFNGEAFPVEQFQRDDVARWSHEFLQTTLKIEQERAPIAGSFTASKESVAALEHLVELAKDLRTLVNTLNDLKASETSGDEKRKAIAELNGKIDGVREALGLLVGCHRPIDEEEAGDMAGRGAGRVGELVVALDKSRGDLKNDLRTLENAAKLIEVTIAEMLEEQVLAMEAALAAFHGDDAMELESRIRNLFPGQPSYTQTRIIESAAELLRQRAELRGQIAQQLQGLQELQVEIIGGGEKPGHIAASLKILAGLQGAEQTLSYRQGKQAGLREFGDWYTGTTAAVHDAGDAKKIAHWWNSSHMVNAQNAINAAAHDLAALKLPERRAAFDKHVQDATDTAVEFKKRVSDLQKSARRLDKLETMLELAVGQLQVTLTAN